MAETTNPVLKQPANRKTKIWRYMDFAHFVSMLEHRALWFCNLSCFLDPYEGFHPLKKQQLRNQFLSDMRTSGLTDLNAALVESLARHFDETGRRTYANCWNANTYESAAFWNMYGPEGKTIAIQSTYERLNDVLDDEHIYLSLVNYLPEDKYIFDIRSTVSIAIHKRLSFAHEMEVRAFYLEWMYTDPCTSRPVLRKPRQGDWVEVDLAHLVEAVYISPTAYHWIYDLMEKITKRYGYNFPLVQSKLLTPFAE